MAGASQKKIAANNVRALKEIHLLSLAVNLVAVLSLALLRRPANWKPYALLAVPLALSELTLEKSGRPRYGPDGKLCNTAIDLAQSGLTEYLFDVVYFTLIEDILMVVTGSNRVWWLYLVVPGFAGYKAYGILKYGKGLFGGGGGSAGGAGSPAADETADDGGAVKSKRQAKLEARAQRGGKRKVVR